MDNSHVALVSMILKAEGFSPYRCDRNIALGINLISLTKVLRAAQNDDILTLKAEDSPDVVNLVFESAETDRLSEYDIKLMDIDQEHLAIPETDYAATVEMPSAEFQRICRDLNALSESGMFFYVPRPSNIHFLTPTPSNSRNRSLQRRRQILLPGRHRQRSRHPPPAFQRREARTGRVNRPHRTRLSHLLPEIPRQLLQSHRSFREGPPVLVSGGTALGRL